MTAPVRSKNEEWGDETNRQDSEDDSNSYEYDEKTYDYKFKICVLGESGVGKTSLIKRFVYNAFDEDSNGNLEEPDVSNFTRTKSTIGVDCCTKVVIMRGHKIALEIWDTAGQERFNALTSSYLRSANAIILVYDITDHATFEKLENKWLEFITTNLPTNSYGKFDARLAIVANKLDLNDDRVVPKKEGVRLAAMNNSRFFEASACSGKNVKEFFRSICDSICDYWCDLRGNPSFFPSDADINKVRLKTSRKNKNATKSNCVKC